MANLSPDAIGRGWRITAVVLGCLVALGLPYIIISDLADRTAPAARTGVTATPPSGVAGDPPAGGTTTGSPTTAGAGEVTGADTGPGSPLAKATESCRLAALRVSATLGAANVSLAQFDKHIDAMNLLVAGKISFAVATQFWDETRVGAMQNATAFARAEKGLAAADTPCAGLPAEVAHDLPYGEVDRLNRCVAYVSQGRAALRKANTAVETWVHHIHDMEMLRKGEITPAQATAAWKKTWRTGERQLKAFEAADARATAAGCTLA